MAVLVASPIAVSFAQQGSNVPARGNGPYGGGPGMMGGCDGDCMSAGMKGSGMRGPGMMGGYDHDCGVDHVGWDPGLKLSHDQQTRMNAIVDQSRKARWLLMGKMLDEQSALRDFYTATRQPSTPVTPRCATCASRCTGSLSTNTSVSMHCLPASSANGCATTDAKWKPPECGPA
ncbi:hypothetical protein PWP93_35955 [Paraburkholderia sp. A1RI-2L]|uniref:hypothetical protein n=1 Tax=Paraburkholderia sp. A1RI-2L TaxID=3028367 RepID=UPI003B8270D6